MSRERRRQRRAEGSRRGPEHSAVKEGWFIPGQVTVEQVEARATELRKGMSDDDWAGGDERRRGRVEGMAIALSILKGTPARGELLRILKGAG